MKKQLNLCVKLNAAVIIFLAFYGFLIPAGLIINDLSDPGLRSSVTPRCVFRWHKSLSGKYEKWAKHRASKGAAANLTTDNISGTEWPMFGSVFFSMGNRVTAAGNNVETLPWK